MTIELKREKVKDSFVNYYENRHMVMGFTEHQFQLEDLALLFTYKRLVELKQIHSAIVHNAGEIAPGTEATEGKETEGDGLIIDEPGIMAVIKTADCTPLFLWDDTYNFAGVIHIGWQGLFKGMEKRTLEKVTQNTLSKPQPGSLANLSFYMGPAIEQKCYEVGPDLYEKFAGKAYRENIFTNSPYVKGKYVMDVKKGISLSLQEMGIAEERIMDSGLCTFCPEAAASVTSDVVNPVREKKTARFPSYRREKGDTRIYNFVMLK